MSSNNIIEALAFSDKCLNDTFFMTPEEDGISSYGFNILDDNSVAWDEIYECVIDDYWFNKIADELSVDVYVVRKALLNKASMLRLCSRLNYLNIKWRLANFMKTFNKSS